MVITGSYELLSQVGTALTDELDEPLAVKLCAVAGRRASGAQRRVEKLAGQRLSGADDGQDSSRMARIPSDLIAMPGS